uniref:Ribonuclease A-domain domain-containing protein n=1 Tax=Maylandia zebra TaxID=106582 RepID=A0A3P9DTQ1_9CICH
MKTLFVCMMLVLLFASGFSKVNNFLPSEHRPEETPYEKFRRQHVDAKMTEKLCNTEISNRNIYKLDNSCKETNTFILSIPYDENSGMTYSTATFRIIKCKLKHQGARKPSCQYEGRLLTNRIIVVKCEGKLPVHFDRDLLPSELVGVVDVLAGSPQTD